jgi:site-specific DNA-methyltransferase (adenine-specific)
VIKISNPRVRGGHPTQKPVELMEYIVKTYSNEGGLVLDCCMGHGTTGVACVSLGRDFIGMEINKDYFDTAVNKINEVPYFWDLVT